MHVQPAVSAATEQVVSAAGSVKDTVSDATQGIRDKARIEGSPPGKRAYVPVLPSVNTSPPGPL